ncbi:hypothetical protein Lal_00005860 [Lupinus albus]|nr:hypothetical protein Lal_00005860 [Lupinus albus]
MNSTIKAICLARKKGWRRIWLECDSTIVVDIFNGRTNVPWKLQNDGLICKSKLDLMDFKISHIYREGFVICKALCGFLAQAAPIAQAILVAKASHINAWWKRSCGSLAQARVSHKPKSVFRLSERIALKRHFQDCRPNSPWVSRLSEKIMLKRQFQA